MRNHSGSLCSRVKQADRGQVLVEFLVTAVLVLVPLFIAMVTLGKYLDAKHKVEVGARYIAWERTVWSEGSQSWPRVATGKSDNSLLGEAQARVFGKRDAGLVSDGDESLRRYKVDPLLEYSYGHTVGNGPIMQQAGAAVGTPLYVGSSTQRRSAPGSSAVLEGAIESISRVPLFGQFDVAQDGAHTGNVSLTLLPPARVPEMSRLNILLNRSVTLITDPWSSGGPRHVRRRVEGLTPTSQLGGIVSVITELPLRIGPLAVISRLDAGFVDPDVVPVQYLGNYE